MIILHGRLCWKRRQRTFDLKLLGVPFYPSILYSSPFARADGLDAWGSLIVGFFFVAVVTYSLAHVWFVSH